MTIDLQRAGYLAGAALCLWPAVTAPVALAAGVAFALAFGHPCPDAAARAGELLLKAAVVGLGFGLPLGAVLYTGAFGVVLTGAAVVAVLALGLGLARAFSMPRDTGVLVAAGTAICGGSAIAAVVPAIGARREAIAVAMAAVFVLNAAALVLFPLLGHLAGLSQQAFALWSAIAIHDASSVIGAASVYGDQALAEATVLKLARALWIVPVVLMFALRSPGAGIGRRVRVRWPWFIGLFVLAAAVRSLVTDWSPAFDALASAARQLMVPVLFVIGSGLSPTAFRQAAGGRALGVAGLLWLIVSAVSLIAVQMFLPGSQVAS